MKSDTSDRSTGGTQQGKTSSGLGDFFRKKRQERPVEDFVSPKLTDEALEKLNSPPAISEEQERRHQEYLSRVLGSIAGVALAPTNDTTNTGITKSEPVKEEEMTSQVVPSATIRFEDKAEVAPVKDEVPVTTTNIIEPPAPEVAPSASEKFDENAFNDTPTEENGDNMTVQNKEVKPTEVTGKNTQVPVRPIPDLEQVSQNLMQALITITATAGMSEELKQRLFGGEIDTSKFKDERVPNALVPRLVELSKILLHRSEVANENINELTKLA